MALIIAYSGKKTFFFTHYFSHTILESHSIRMEVPTNPLLQKLQYKQGPRITLREGIRVAVRAPEAPLVETNGPAQAQAAMAIKVVDKRHPGFQRDVVLHRMYQQQQQGKGIRTLIPGTTVGSSSTEMIAPKKFGKIAKVTIHSSEVEVEREVEREVELEKEIIQIAVPSKKRMTQKTRIVAETATKRPFA